MRAQEAGAADPPLRSVFPRRRLEVPGGPHLSVVTTAPATGGRDSTPLLFLHGAFGGAWHWEDHFLPAAARSGRAAWALDLRGHGDSEGFDRLEQTGLRDFEADVRAALRLIGRPPVIVAHSLGGLLAQRLAAQERIAGLVLLASLPPEGMFFVGPRFAATDTLIWLEALTGSLAKTGAPIRDAARRLLAGEGLPPALVERYAPRMGPESARALAEAHAPGVVPSAGIAGIPCLVLGGRLDRLILRATALRTALYHRAEFRTVAGMGHFMPLDPGADRLAADVMDWIDTVVP